MTIVSGLIAFIVAISRLVVPIRESKLKEKALLLEKRIIQLKEMQKFELAQEANQLQKELTEIEKKLRAYPGIISILSVLTVVTTGITLTMLFIK